MRWALCLLLLLSAAIAAADRFDDLIEAKMREQRIPGLAFAVVYRGRMVISRGYGYAEIEKKTPIASNTRFEIASVSKPFVATTALMLWEQGKFRLEEPIGKYVTDLPAAWAAVPIQHLFNHTSGIPEFRTGRTFVQKRMEETPHAEIYRGLSEKLDFPPGDHFFYSNTNYMLIGDLIASLTGKPYTDLIRRWIFEPADMKNTAFVGEKVEKAQGYSSFVDKFQASMDSSLAWAGPGGSIISTVEDLVKFDNALQNQKFIRPATQSLMLSPTTSRLGEVNYGLGWQLGKVGPVKVALHSGRMNGYSSMYMRLLDQAISVVVLTNAFDIDGNSIARGILGIYFPELDPGQLTPIVDDDPSTTAKHAEVLHAILRSQPDMSVFTEGYKQVVPEEKLKAIGANLRRGGSVEPFQLLRRFKKDGFDHHEYLVMQGRVKLVVKYVVDGSGLVSGLLITSG